MSDATNEHDGPDGSSDQTEEQRQRAEDLPDGTASGNATEDPGQDSDTNSGGEPAEPEKQ